jgi:hypothetical protein
MAPLLLLQLLPLLLLLLVLSLQKGLLQQQGLCGSSSRLQQHLLCQAAWRLSSSSSKDWVLFTTPANGGGRRTPG